MSGLRRITLLRQKGILISTKRKENINLESRNSECINHCSLKIFCHGSSAINSFKSCVLHH